jgi:hypothetical protein
MTAKTRKIKKTSNKTKKRVSKSHIFADKRPWRVTYRNINLEKTVNIFKNGKEKDNFLKKIEKDNLYIYGINNLTDKQVEYYKKQGLL